MDTLHFYPFYPFNKMDKISQQKFILSEMDKLCAWVLTMYVKIASCQKTKCLSTLRRLIVYWLKPCVVFE